MLVRITLYWVLLSRQRLETVRKDAEGGRLTPYTSLLRVGGPAVVVQFRRVGIAA